MRIAVVHHNLEHYGGAERVSVLTARELGADLITSRADKSVVKELGWEHARIIELGDIAPRFPRRYIDAHFMFAHADLSAYDVLILMSEWTIAARRASSICLWYVHTPKRDVWDRYRAEQAGRRPLSKLSLFVWAKINRSIDRRAVRSIPTIVCNSRTVQQRCRTFWGIEPHVLEPPVGPIKASKPIAGHWISINRLHPSKRIDLQIEAFRSMPDKNLVIVGSYEHAPEFNAERERLARMLPDNVKIRSFVTNDELEQSLAKAEGLLATAEDEDYGLSITEGYRFGTPAVAVNAGGYKETVTHGETGYLVNPTPEAIVDAVRTISADPSRFRDACYARARDVSLERFVRQLKRLAGIDGS